MAKKKLLYDDEDESTEKTSEKGDFVYDEITGGRGKKRVLDALNKSRLGKHEMDELFCEWD
jgi:hypothetical protein